MPKATKPTKPSRQVPKSRDQQKKAGLIAATSRSIHGKPVKRIGQ